MESDFGHSQVKISVVAETYWIFVYASKVKMFMCQYKKSLKLKLKGYGGSRLIAVAHLSMEVCLLYGPYILLG